MKSTPPAVAFGVRHSLFDILRFAFELLRGSRGSYKLRYLPLPPGEGKLQLPHHGREHKKVKNSSLSTRVYYARGAMRDVT